MTVEVALRSVFEALGDRPSRCRGAIFCTYTLDLRFFEEQVLAAVLDLESDPQEATQRFLEEARARIREVPIALIADGSMVEGGRRVPFDLLEVHSCTFHPKLALLLFDKSARLLMGSGNLTEGGFKGNTELFVTLDLAYKDRRGLLASIYSFVSAIKPLLRSPGTQLDEALKELTRLCPSVVDSRAAKNDLQFLHSASGESLLEQLFRMLPSDVRIDRAGLLAPFFEKDDESLDASVLGHIRSEAKRRGKTPAFDVGFSWDDNPKSPPTGKTPDFEKELGTLWGYHERSGESVKLEYYVPTRVTAQRVYHETQWGEPKTWELEEALAACAERKTWPVGKVQAYGPENLLAELAKACGDLTCWLFPAWRVENEHIVHRPLHAKLLLLQCTESNDAFTYVLVGSPNMSRKALLLRSPEANVETALVFKVPGTVTLAEVAPQLVRCPEGQIELSERIFKTPGPNYGLVIRKAVFDAVAERLEIEWDLDRLSSPGKRPPNPWQVVYPTTPERVLHQGRLPTASVMHIEKFQLSLTTAELHVVAETERYSVQIEVANIAALPADPVAANLGLEELLALLGGRVGFERVARQRKRAAQGDTTEGILETVFGGKFQPSDVFRAWFGLRKDLEDPMLSIGGAKVVLDGSAGARALWRRMQEAIDSGRLTKEEVWFYGQELLRTLRPIQWPEDVVSLDKKALLDNYLEQVSRDIAALSPPTAKLPGVKELSRLYEAAGG